MPRLRVTLKDAIGLYNDSVGDYLYYPADKPKQLWYQLPAEWFAQDQLHQDKQVALFEQIYGADWLNGNSDGSRYKVLEYELHRLTASEERDRPWRDAEYECFRVNADGQSQAVTPAEF